MNEVASLPPRSSWEWLVDAALREDLGPGDVTSQALLAEEYPGAARLEARQDLVLCGQVLAAAVFERCGVIYELRADDGDGLVAGDCAAAVRGSARGILAGERTALNFLQRLSGIATRTR